MNYDVQVMTYKIKKSASLFEDSKMYQNVSKVGAALKTQCSKTIKIVFPQIFFDLVKISTYSCKLCFKLSSAQNINVNSFAPKNIVTTLLSSVICK